MCPIKNQRESTNQSRAHSPEQKVLPPLWARKYYCTKFYVNQLKYFRSRSIPRQLHNKSFIIEWICHTQIRASKLASTASGLGCVLIRQSFMAKPFIYIDIYVYIDEKLAVWEKVESLKNFKIYSTVY